MTCTQESAPGYENRRITAEFLSEKIGDFSQRFYICGPDSFVVEIKSVLKRLGASSKSLVFEK
jgi:cytochrome-b5 reductase